MASASGMPLYEKYRPRDWRGVIGHADAVRKCKSILSRGWGGRAWWLSGPSGTGKTTMARIIAAEGAEPCCVVEIDASQVTGAWLTEMQRQMVSYGWPPKGGRAWIINEAHGLRNSAALRQLLVALEPLPSHCCMLFTTTDAGEQLLLADAIDADPLLSRCHVIRLTRDKLVPAFARAAQRIARSEGLDGSEFAIYRKAVRAHRCNMRAILQELETGTLETVDASDLSRSDKLRCKGCKQAVRPGRQYCSTSCYLDWLRRRKTG